MKKVFIFAVFLLLIPQAVQAATLQTNCIAFWNLDTNSTDETGNGYNGTDTNISYSGNKATFYTGSSKSVVTTSMNSTATDFTCSAWIHSTGAGPDGYDRIVDKAYATGFWFGRNNTNANSVAGFVRNGTLITGTASDNADHHVAMTRSGTTLTIYVDGSSVGSQTESSTALDTTGLCIGDAAAGSGAGEARYKGQIWDVGFWTIALPATGSNSIASLYNSGTPLNWAGMAGGAGPRSFSVILSSSQPALKPIWQLQAAARPRSFVDSVPAN